MTEQRVRAAVDANPSLRVLQLRSRRDVELLLAALAMDSGRVRSFRA